MSLRLWITRCSGPVAVPLRRRCTCCSSTASTSLRTAAEARVLLPCSASRDDPHLVAASERESPRHRAALWSVRSQAPRGGAICTSLETQHPEEQESPHSRPAWVVPVRALIHLLSMRPHGASRCTRTSPASTVRTVAWRPQGGDRNGASRIGLCSPLVLLRAAQPVLASWLCPRLRHRREAVRTLVPRAAPPGGSPVADP